MKKLILITFLATILCGCNLGSSTFISKENGFQIKFPCNYETTPEKLYICRDESSVYSVNFLKNGEDSYQEKKKMFEGFVKMDQEENDTAENKKKESNLTEKTFKGYKSLEHTSNHFKINDSGDKILEKKIKDIVILKDNVTVMTSVMVDNDSGKLSKDKFEKLTKTIDPFFDSIELK